jgi:hypothetical protein
MIDLKVKITEEDSGWDKLAQNLEKLGGKEAVVGIQANEDTELLKYAGANEFGAKIRVTPKMRGFFRHKFGVNLKKDIITIPPRPFIRQTFEKRLEELQKIGFDLGELVLQDKINLNAALELWGDQFVAFIREEVAEGNNFEANAPFTVEQKGDGKHPLQDSGRLMQALKTVVE